LPGESLKVKISRRHYSRSVPYTILNRNPGRIIDSGDQLSRKLLLAYILILAAGMSLIPFTIDPFLPTLPMAADDFGVPNSTLQLTLTGVTIGFALGQLIAGPLSDAIGRRKPLLFALALYVVSATLVFFAPNIEMFFLMRVLMGMAAAAANAVSLAIIRDLYSGMPMLKMLGRIFAVQSLAPIVAPILGSQLVGFIEWRALFLVFAFLFLIVLLFANSLLIETLPHARRRSSTPLGLMRGFRNVLRDRIFVGLMIFSALQVSAIFAYVNITPFLYQDTYGISVSNFGWWFALNSFGLWLGIQLGSRLPRFAPAPWLLAGYAALGAIIGGSAMLAASGDFWLVQLIFFGFAFNFGLSITSVQTLALLKHGSEAGTASSLLGVANFVVTATASSLYVGLGTDSSIGLGSWILVTYLIGLASLVFVVRPWAVTDMRD
jgi:MFS transporter, DHA1 family, multidrug resistance protein